MKISSRLILGALCAVIGLLALINPQASIQAMVIITGIASIISGVIMISRAKTLCPEPRFSRVIIIRSVIGIVIGLLAIIMPFAMFRTLQSVVRVFLYILAVFLFLSAVSEFAVIIGTGATARPLMGEAVITLGIAILLFLMPWNFGVTLVRIAGALIFCASIIYCVVEWRARSVEVEAVEVTETVEGEPGVTPDEPGAAADTTGTADAGAASESSAPAGDAGESPAGNAGKPAPDAAESGTGEAE